MIGEEVIAVYGDAGDGEELFEMQKLVRCKECKHKDEIVNYCYENDRDVNADDFCSYGVKKGATEYIPLVRCKACKWRNKFGCHNPIWGDGWGNYPPPNPSDEDFCSYGERRES